MQPPDLWTTPELSFADTDWNFLPAHHATPYISTPDGLNMSVPEYDVASAFASLSDLDSVELQSQHAFSVAPSSANSQGEITQYHF